MAEALKTFFSPAKVREIGASVARVAPEFPLERFVRMASRGLHELELLDRAHHIAAALSACLPPKYEDAITILIASLGREHQDDELQGAGMAPFFYLPHVMFVAEHGLRDFERSMWAQRELTKRFTAELSIRPFLQEYPERTLAVLAEWAKDPDPHVRRLVSEGTRPRLPWAPRVPFLDEHPERVLPLLEMLKDDPTTLVRRSVANHLNDIGKPRPELLVEICRRWLHGASKERRALVLYALRSAVKRGVPGALSLLGHGDTPSVSIEDVRFDPGRVAIGNKVRVSFALASTSTATQALLVDLVVGFVKANGRTSPKVFKLSRVTLPPRGRAELSKLISLAVHTTRKPYTGIHPVEVAINGVRLPAGSFEVVAPDE